MTQNIINKIPYHRLPNFEHLYLEDSYVLNIKVEESSVQIFVEAVLNEGHPQYSAPLPNEQYCYRKACIFFPSVDKVTWVKKIMRPYKDATGKIDYGNIDRFYFSEGHYHLLGDWGEIDIVSSEPKFEFVVQ